MTLIAKLTTGWDDPPPLGVTAFDLNEQAANSENYINSISEQLAKEHTKQIYCLDQLLRKSTKGFKPIKQFVGVLTTLTNNKEFICYIDVFAYSFLKGAKNFDLLLLFEKKHNQEFIHTYNHWSEIFGNLEKFERFGQKNISDEQKKQYLALREIVSRPSVRDEIRTLATLLISGPSTLEQVTEDLGLNYTLGQRTVGVFENIGVVKQRRKRIYAIEKEALPVVIFCLRETIGLDLLNNLDIRED